MFLPQWYQNPHQLHPFDLSLKGRLHQPRAKARPLSRRPGQTPQKMIGALEGRLKAANLQGVFGGCEVGGGGLEMEEGKAVVFKPMLLLDNPDNDIPIRLGLGIPAWENSGCD